MKFICGLPLGRSRSSGSCGEEFDTWEQLANHMNTDHRLGVWIRGGTLEQGSDKRSDYRKKPEICSA